MNGVDARRIIRIARDLVMQLRVVDPSQSAVTIPEKEGDDAFASSWDVSQEWHNTVLHVHRLSLIFARKLTTTVEEDKSKQECFEEACRREKKTLKEKHTLETMLQSEREQRLIESFDVAKRQQGLESDLNTVNTMRDQKIQLLTNTAEVDEEENQALYDALEADLLRQVHALEQELLGMQQGQAIVEGALRKKKAKAEQEVEVWVQRHADEVGLKQSEYYEAVGNCRAVLRELEESSRTYSCLVEEREAYEERKQQEAQIARETQAHDLLRRRAARIIQRAWKAYQKLSHAKRKAVVQSDARLGKKNTGSTKSAKAGGRSK